MNGTGKKTEDQYLSSTVLKAVDILNLIAYAGSTPSEISATLKLNKTTVHRLLCTLEYAGFIEQIPNTHEYRIGIKLVGICSTRVNDIEIITEAKPYLTELVRQINQPVHLGIYNAGKAVYVDKIDVINTIRIYSAIGKAIPVHCSALGKALLLDRSDEEILQILHAMGCRLLRMKRLQTRRHCLPRFARHVCEATRKIMENMRKPCIVLPRRFMITAMLLLLL